MRTLKIAIALTTTSCFSVAALAQKSAPATPSDSFYYAPQGAYLETYQEESMKIKREEDAQREVLAKRAKDEERKVELERQIAAKKFQIENYKLQQSRVETEMKHSSADLEAMQHDLNLTEQEYASFQQIGDQQMTQADQSRADLVQAKIKFEDAQEKFRTSKLALTKTLADKKAEIQQIKSELAVATANAENLESQNGLLQVDEVRLKMEVAAAQNTIDKKKADIARLFNELDSTKRKLEQTRSDYFAANLEFKKVEAKKDETDRKVTAEIKNLNDSAEAALRSKAINESEKIRLEAEIDRLKSYLAAVKKTSNQALDASVDSQASVMESRLALQTMKAELVKQVAEADKEASKKDRSSARLRKLASIAEASDMMDGAKSWVVRKNCPLHKRASSRSEVVPADLSVGQKLIGSDYSSSWIKVLNSSGNPAFIKKDCGSFE